MRHRHGVDIQSGVPVIRNGEVAILPNDGPPDLRSWEHDIGGDVWRARLMQSQALSKSYCQAE